MDQTCDGEKFIALTRDAVFDTLKFTTGLDVRAGRIEQSEKTQALPTVAISGAVDVACSTFSGTVILSFPEKTFLAMMSKWLGKPYREITPDIQDGAGELLNILLGKVKREAGKRSHDFRHSIPTIIRGSGIEFVHSDCLTMLLPFVCEGAGEFFLQLAVVNFTTPR